MRYWWKEAVSDGRPHGEPAYGAADAARDALGSVDPARLYLRLPAK